MTFGVPRQKTPEVVDQVSAFGHVRSGQIRPRDVDQAGRVILHGVSRVADVPFDEFVVCRRYLVVVLFFVVRLVALYKPAWKFVYRHSCNLFWTKQQVLVFYVLSFLCSLTLYTFFCVSFIIVYWNSMLNILACCFIKHSLYNTFMS